MARVLCALKHEPKRYLFSVWLLVGMLLAHLIGGSTSRLFVVWIVAVLGWFALYALALIVAALIRAEDSFWRWFARDGD